MTGGGTVSTCRKLARNIDSSSERTMRPGRAWAIRGVPHLNAVENAMMRRKLRQLDTVGGSELVECLRQMAFHCPFADREAGGDFPVRTPLRDSTDDVELAFGQAERLVAPARRRKSMKA